jgi:hypothetical protein
LIIAIAKKLKEISFTGIPHPSGQNMTVIYEDNVDVIYEPINPVLFSAIAEQKLGLGMSWKSWKPQILQV